MLGLLNPEYHIFYEELKGDSKKKCINPDVESLSLAESECKERVSKNKIKRQLVKNDKVEKNKQLKVTKNKKKRQKLN